MKTVYRFYSKPDKEILLNAEDLSLNDKYPLYAVTNNKEIAKDFQEKRNMNKFIMCKSEMDKQEMVQFINSNSGCLLEYRPFLHFKQRYRSDKKVKRADQVKILCTWNEKETVQACLDDQYGESEGPTYNVFPFIFKSKYVYALRKLEYVSFWKLFGRPEIFGSFIPQDDLDDMDYSAPDVSYDELMTFINLFGATMK